MASQPFELVVADLETRAALDFLERTLREHPACDVLLMSADPELEETVADLDRTAADVLVKPVSDAHLRRVIERSLERRSLRVENRRLRDELSAADQCRAFALSLDPGKIYPMALDTLLSVLSRVRGVAVFHRTSIPVNDAIAFRGLSEGQARRIRQLLLEEKPLDLEGFTRVEVLKRTGLHAALREAGVGTDGLLSVPVRGEEAEAGVIWVMDDGRAFQPDEIERAQVVANHATSALHNAERYHMAKERAFVDDVTEVYNARYLLSAIENEIRRANRYNNSVSLLFLDIDRFKLVNDRHGHLVGSRALRSLSQVLSQCVRQVDTLARYGGDEFTIMLVDTGHDEAMRIARRIRQAVEEHIFETEGKASLRLTISVGVASFPMHGTARDTLLDASDKAMYRAKSLGRNRVASASDLTL
jgi:diguanylate cyclase (GGDEF)-like protein